MVCANFHPISRAQPGIRWHIVKRHSALTLEGCKQVMRMNPNLDGCAHEYTPSILFILHGEGTCQVEEEEEDGYTLLAAIKAE